MSLRWQQNVKQRVRVIKLTIRQSLWRRANTRKVSFQTFYGGQFTSSTQLIILNYLVILSHRRSATVSLESYSLLKIKQISSTLLSDKKTECASYTPNNKTENRKRDLHCTNVTIKQKQSARINYITITQKKECTSYKRNNNTAIEAINQKIVCASHSRNNQTGNRVQITYETITQKQNARLTSVTITHKTECASYKSNYHTEKRMRELQT